MRDTQIGSTLRALRLRRGWRQADVSARAAVARSVISSLEAGNLGRHTLDALRRSVEVCGGALQIAVRVPGGDVMRLLDADHALLQSYWAHSLRRYGWLVEAEVTFNHYGERGSLDLLAWQPARRLLLVIEVKTVIVDAQELLAGIDRKARIAAVIARERGWRPVAVIPAVFVLDGSTARRRMAEHAPLFGRFNLRGRAARAWIRRPADLEPMRTGVLTFTALSPARSDDLRRAGRRRVRLSPGQPRSAERNQRGGSGPETA